MQKRKSLLFFLITFFLLFSVPIFSNAATLEEKYNIKIIPEEKVSDQDSDKIIFYDEDGKIKAGDFSDVFDYLKSKYGNQNNQYAGKTWSKVDKSGDYYDAIIFRQYIQEKTGFTGQMSTTKAKDIALIPEDSSLNIVFTLQDYLKPFALLLAATYSIKSFGEACKNFKTKKQLLVSSIWMFIPIIIIANIQYLTKTFVIISNNTIKVVTDIISIFADGADGLNVIAFEDIIDIAKRADHASFNDSFGAMSSANFQTQFGGGLSLASSAAFMVIMYSGKLSFMIYLTLFSIAAANIPVGRLDSEGFKFFLSTCAMAITPILNIILMTIEIELRTSIGNSNQIVGVFGTFIIPIVTIIGMMQMKTIAKSIVKLAARKMRI